MAENLGLAAVVLGPLWVDLDEAQQRRVLEATTSRRVAAGDALLTQGEFADQMYAVAEGALSVHVTAGTERLDVGSLGPGDWVGEVGLFDPGPASATVVATAPSLVLEMTNEQLRTLRDNDPDAGAKLVRALCRSLAKRLRTSSHGFLRCGEEVWTLDTAPAPTREGLLGALRSIFRGR